MERPAFQLTIVSLLGLVACIALNLWLFRLGPLLGIIGLNISKHLLIASLCRILGVDRRRPSVPSPAIPAGSTSGPLPAGLDT